MLTTPPVLLVSVVAPADKDESKEIVTASEVPDVIIHETERPAYLAPYKPVVPKIFRPKVESEEVEPPETGFGERIKAFTKFSTNFFLSLFRSSIAIFVFSSWRSINAKEF